MPGWPGEQRAAQPAASLRDRLAAAFTWPHAAARLIEILAGLHDEHGRPFWAPGPAGEAGGAR